MVRAEQLRHPEGKTCAHCGAKHSLDWETDANGNAFCRPECAHHYREHKYERARKHRQSQAPDTTPTREDRITCRDCGETWDYADLDGNGATGKDVVTRREMTVTWQACPHCQTTLVTDGDGYTHNARLESAG